MNTRPPASRPATAITGEFLEGRDLWHQINTRLDNRSGRVAAIAYLGIDAPLLLTGWGKGDLILCNAGEKALRSGSTHPDALKHFIDAGVEVRSSGVLHAKVIATRGVAIVGSMNASHNSTTKMIETAFAVRDKATVSEVVQFVRALRKSSLVVDKKFLTQARKSYRPPKGGGGGGSAASTTPRVGYTVRAFEDHPPMAVEAVAKEQTTIIQQSEALQLDWSWGLLRQYRRDDWAVDIIGDRVVPPAWCIGVERAKPPSKQWVTTWIERYDAKSIPRRQFEVGLFQRGYRLSEGSFVRSEGLVEAIHDCFGISPQLAYDAIGEQPT